MKSMTDTTTPRPWYTIRNESDDTAEVMIYDQIGESVDWFTGQKTGVSAKDFCADLKAIDKPKIAMHINSGGGAVFEGSAICTAIQEHPAEITAYVDGLAASAACTIACSCDKLVMGKAAFMMIHAAAGGCFGDADEMRKTAQTLDTITGSIANIYAKKSGKPVSDVLAAMNDETWFDAAQAKAWGLADAINDEEEDGDEDDEMDPVNSLTAFSGASPLLTAKFRKMPEALKTRLAASNLARARVIPTQSTDQRPSAQESAMLNVISRDGRQFVMLDGKEHEVTIPSASAPGLDAVNKANEEKLTKAVSDATAAAVQTERGYRSMFNTILNAASLTGDAAIKFENDFYGRDEKDLKFLASHAIGTRATAVGEGSGNPEPQPGDQAAKDATEIGKYCMDRLIKDRTMRHTFKVNSVNPKEASFVNGLEKFIAVETKSRADWAIKTPAKEQDEATGNDPVTRALKNKSILDIA